MNYSQIWLLASTDLRRRYRAIRSDRRRMAVFLLAGVLLLIPLSGLLFAAFLFGGSIVKESLPVSMIYIRGGAGALVLMTVLFTAVRTVQTAAIPTNADGVLTMAEHSSVVAALLLVETIAGAGIVLVPGVLAAAAFGIGAGSALAGLTAFAAVFSAAVLGSILGISIGFFIRIGLARSETLSRYRTPIAVVLFVGYMYVFIGLEFESTFEPIVVGLSQTPFGWYADLALAPLVVDSNLGIVGGALFLTLAGTASLGILVNRLASQLWYVESVEGSTGTTASTGLGNVSGLSRPIARVIRKNWLRAWRSPIRLMFVIYPLFFVIAPISDAVQSGVVPSYLPPTVGLYLGWATGAAFTLNPLGDEGGVLPVTLTSPISGQSFLMGCCLSGLLIGLPIAALGALVAGLAAGVSMSMVVGSVVFAIILTIAATGIASGVGVTFPRFEPVTVTRGRKAVVPSLFGFALYSLALTLSAVPGLVVLSSEVQAALQSTVAFTTAELLVFGIGATTLIAGLLGLIGFVHAVNSFDSFYLE